MITKDRINVFTDALRVVGNAIVCGGFLAALIGAVFVLGILLEGLK